MAQTVTFIHAADLHLGAAFKGLVSLSGATGNHFINAVSQAYKKVIDSCIEKNVDFLVLAGDSFNEGKAPYRIEREFLDGLLRLENSGIQVYMCTGNHDPLSKWGTRLDSLPANVHMFPAGKPGYFLFGKGDEPLVALAGRSFLDRNERGDLTEGLNRTAAFDTLGTTPFALGVLHTGIYDQNYAPCSLETLRQADFDYWALGHIHDQGVVLDGGSLALYPGSPQGLDINESLATHGCFHVTLEEGRAPRFEQITTASITWAQPTIDVSEVVSLDELVDTIGSFGEDLTALHNTPVCARVTLAGRSKLHERLLEEGSFLDVIEVINNRYHSDQRWFYVDDIANRTRASIDIGTLEGEGLFPATLLRGARELDENRSSLESIIANAFEKQNLRLSEVELDYQEAIEAAQSLCIDLLVGGEA
ncbi:MAG: DNA repair exonuclease [Actinobacteria bacterium]|nr:DNA repair exonuclease [Actinomycetota bacterium]